ncbi:MAG: 23S rRNA (guanosine(2251)-2'-O)-methyltransferase RlmB [Solobacterium sp.]|nr:23S rRNA (guanosine(2251)-2'-O)-methyltransferase RlmB [Solobacterium sp.]
MAQWIYGKNVVKQILTDHDRTVRLMLAVKDPEIEKLAAAANVRVDRCDRKMLTKLTGTDRHQGVAAEIRPYQTYTVDELIRNVSDRGLLILLDELEDPHNLGAVLRTADAVGADGVIFKKTNAAGLTPTVAKVSAGAIDTVKCAAVTNLARTLDELKKKGWWVVGADMDGQDYRSLKYDFNTVLVIGNEGKGMSRLVEEKCDYIISLPMEGKISSLNASVSAGILMYHIHSCRFPLAAG